VVAFAVSYFARGYLAGHHRFGAYGLLVLLESTSRCLFAVAVAVGIAEGQDAVAFGMLAAPIASLTVVPFALRRVHRSPDPPSDSAAEQAEFTLAHGAGFAAAVLLVMLSEQTFINAGPLIVNATEGGAEGAALAGFTFNVLLIARAPLQLFQSIQAPILPHLTKMRGAGDADGFRRTVSITVGAIASFAGVVALVMLAIGPWVMDILFGSDTDYGRAGLALIAVGMGLYLAGATLNQALLARGLTRQAAACWVVSAAAFVGFLLIPGWDDRVLQLEVGYASGAALLCALLYWLYRQPQ
jgi:O-antigen/teichoic acid export membrane protein